MITRRRTCASPPYLSIFCRSVKIQMKFKAMLKNWFLIDLWKSKLCERCEPGEIRHDRRPEIQPRLLENTWSSLFDRCWFAPMGVTLWKPYNIISFCPLFEIWDSLKYLRSASRSAECDLTGRTHAEGISPFDWLLSQVLLSEALYVNRKPVELKEEELQTRLLFSEHDLCLRYERVLHINLNTSRELTDHRLNDLHFTPKPH